MRVVVVVVAVGSAVLLMAGPELQKCLCPLLATVFSVQ